MKSPFSRCVLLLALVLPLAATFPAAAREVLLPKVPSSLNPKWEGFVRVTNFSDRAGSITIQGVDDQGTFSPAVTLTLGAGESQQLRSVHLENGSPSRGLPVGIGPPVDNWRLYLESDLDFDVAAFIRTPDGFLTSIHEAAVASGTLNVLPVVNPGNNPNQVSVIRLINNSAEPRSVTVEGVDDAATPSAQVSLTLGPWQAREYTSNQLETGTGIGLTGGLGVGSGKWRLLVRSSGAISVLSMLEDPNGYLNNWSTHMPLAKGPVGLYEGVLREAGIPGEYLLYGIVTPEERLYFYSPNFGEVYVGDYANSGNELTGSVDVIEEYDPPYAQASVSATFRSGDYLTGTADLSSGGTTEFTLKYDTAFERGADLERIAGSYTGDEPGVSYTLTIHADGSFDASDTAGCTYQGQLRVGNPINNLYYAEGTVDCVGFGATPTSGVLVNYDDEAYGDSRALVGIFEAPVFDTALAFSVQKD